MGGKKRAPEDVRHDTTDPVQVLGQVIREHRTSRKLSQRGLATLTDLERSTIAYVERGSRSPSIPTLFELARALEVKASDLLAEVERRLRR